MADQTGENNKSVSKGKTGYHLMLFLDGKDGMIRQLGIGRGVVDFVIILALVLIIVPFVGWKMSHDKVIDLQAKLNQSTAQCEELTAANSELEASNKELSGKVTVLSDTVNAKVEKENKIEKESDIAHMPSGFPLSASASMETSDKEDSKMLVFTAAEGTSVLAAGEGVVLEITTGDSYAKKLTIDHENGYKSIYYNDGSPMVKEGDAVMTSSVLFLIGEDNSKLGYEIYKDDEAIDPMSLINIDG